VERAEVLARLDELRALAGPRIEARLEAAGLAGWPEQVFLRVLKHEQSLECWGRGAGEREMRLLARYAAPAMPNTDLFAPEAAALSGPKRHGGDRRVPEGAYRLLFHNHRSRFHLSLALGYPNVADALRAERAGILGAEGRAFVQSWWREHGPALERGLLGSTMGLWRARESAALGNEIFVHGGSASVGCVAVGDEGIEELFVLTDARRVAGTAVHIFPCRMDDPVLGERLRELGAAHVELGLFWEGLWPLYEAFERERRVPAAGVDEQTGRYIVLA
jgi:murein L,D-transpeptidase YafK